MKFSEMKNKSYRLLFGSLFFAILPLLILITIGRILPAYFFLLFLVFSIFSSSTFIICTLWFLVMTKQWKRNFMKTNKLAASFTVACCNIVELDKIRPTKIDLKKNHTGLRALFSNSPPYFRGLLTTEDAYLGFIETDGLGLPFTLGARNLMPVHYVSEGLHDIIISPTGNDDGHISFPFTVSRGRKYIIFYDEVKQIVEIKDTTDDKDSLVSWI